MKRTYIQVKKLNNLLGDMIASKVEVHVYKKLSYQVNDCIFYGCRTFERIAHCIW